MCSVGASRICSYHDDLYVYGRSQNNRYHTIRCAATRIPKGVKACQYATKACEDPGSAMKALAMGKMKGFLTKDHHFQQGVLVRKERFSFKYFQTVIYVIYSSQIIISSNDACSQSSCSVFFRDKELKTTISSKVSLWGALHFGKSQHPRGVRSISRRTRQRTNGKSDNRGWLGRDEKGPLRIVIMGI